MASFKLSGTWALPRPILLIHKGLSALCSENPVPLVSITSEKDQVAPLSAVIQGISILIFSGLSVYALIYTSSQSLFLLPVLFSAQIFLPQMVSFGRSLEENEPLIRAAEGKVAFAQFPPFFRYLAVAEYQSRSSPGWFDLELVVGMEKNEESDGWRDVKLTTGEAYVRGTVLTVLNGLGCALCMKYALLQSSLLKRVLVSLVIQGGIATLYSDAASYFMEVFLIYSFCQDILMAPLYSTQFFVSIVLLQFSLMAIGWSLPRKLEYGGNQGLITPLIRDLYKPF